MVGTIVPPIDSDNRDLQNMIADLTRDPSRFASMSMRTCAAMVNGSGSPGPTGRSEMKQERRWKFYASATISLRSTLFQEKLKKTAEDLRETRDFLENLIGHANAPIAVWDPLLKITRFNHAAERLTGYCSKDVLGHHLQDPFPGGDRDEYLAYIEEHSFQGSIGMQWRFPY